MRHVKSALVHPSSLKKFFSRFKKADFKPRAILAYPHVRMLNKCHLLLEPRRCRWQMYPIRSLSVSWIIWLAQHDPKKAFASNQVDHFCQNIWQQHWTGVKNILANLKGTNNNGLYFVSISGNSGGIQVELVGYVYSDFTGDLDSCRSASGCLFWWQWPRFMM